MLATLGNCWILVWLGPLGHRAILGGKNPTIECPRQNFGGLRKWNSFGLCPFPLRKMTGCVFPSPGPFLLTFLRPPFLKEIPSFSVGRIRPDPPQNPVPASSRFSTQKSSSEVSRNKVFFGKDIAWEGRGEVAWKIRKNGSAKKVGFL